MKDSQHSSRAWRHLEETFLRALDLAPAQRSAFLDSACQGEPEVRAEVEAMLRAHDEGEELALERRLFPSDDLESEPDRMLGASIGGYRVIGLLGRGGMGEVYRAFDPSLDREVAIKVLPVEVSDDPDRLARFQREAKALAAIRHQGVVTVFSVEESDGIHFLTMELVEGTTLTQQIPETGMDLTRFRELGLQLAEALAAAHDLGIVHRDLKPSNVLVDSAGAATVIDFGLVQRSAGAAEEDATTLDVAGQTRTGVVMGTWRYMSPEQARGAEVDARSDVFSLGTVFYEMLSGKSPFDRPSEAEIVASILQEQQTPLSELRPEVPAELSDIVERCLEKDTDQRYASAAELREALRDAMPRPDIVSGTRSRFPRLLVPALAVLVLILVGVGGWLWRQSARSDQLLWARVEAIPEVVRLIGENRRREAAELAVEAESILGDDPALALLWPQMTSPFRVVTDPPGAQVIVRPYVSDEDAWQSLGETPYTDDRFPAGAFRFRIEMEGFEPVEAARSLLPANQLSELANAGFDYLTDPSYVLDLRLSREGDLPEGMIAVTGGPYGTVPLQGFAPIDPRWVPEFLIDRTEVTHRAYEEFVNAGGYEDRGHWQEPFRRDGEQIAWQTAMEEFGDATDRRGPATWVIGRPQEGREDYPVAGVSWFEAAAYCRWRGKSLPTLYHWARAALPSSDSWIPFNPLLAAASNFGGQGPRPAGIGDGIGVTGAFDLIGNVREWVSTASADRRHLMGGAWSDPLYLLHDPSAASPWQREATDGFRCALFPDGEAPEHLRASFQLPPQDFSASKPVLDAVFNTARSYIAYDSGQPLAASVDSTRELEWGATLEWVSVDTPYGERLPIRLHLPTSAEPPYQAVVFFPGGNVLRGSTIEDPQPPLDLLVRGGRALVEPVYDGAFQRNDGRTVQRWTSPRTQNVLMAHWTQDLGRALDYLEQRSDFDATKVAFLGLSLGASLAPNLLAFETRFHTALLYSGGFSRREPQALVDFRSGLAMRVRLPLLMLGGRDDFVNPVDPHQRAMFRFFGTPEEDKHIRVYDAGHWPLPMNEVIRETVDFLDRYQGPVE